MSLEGYQAIKTIPSTSKGWSSWNTSLQNLFCTIHRSFLKVKLDMTKAKKKHWQLWKAGGPKWLVFFFGDVLACWERKQPTSLTSPRPLDWKSLGSRSEVSMIRFWTLYKLWRPWKSSWNSAHLNIIKLSSFSIFWTSRKLLVVTSREENLLICFVIAKIYS